MQHYNYGICCFSTSFSRVAPTELCASIFIFHGCLNNDYFDLTAIATVVTIAEILKNNGLAVEKKIMNRWLVWRMRPGGRLLQKARIEILLGKTENFDELMAAAAQRGDGDDEQN
ncbi:unnamed protein product [Musa acuminata subsp. malaccensis]|uniref:(wild Malaysian banana) hypothetical protein n=1 Tax=Musa acuminata subsp. malaccensis TaxID=214687 RepID=A0A804JU46_MUSAM|nr:unnamed protein product [Musa acuminata subsp. malaccensis]